jgi:hypothetical protein
MARPADQHYPRQRLIPDGNRQPPGQHHITAAELDITQTRAGRHAISIAHATARFTFMLGETLLQPVPEPRIGPSECTRPGGGVQAEERGIGVPRELGFRQAHLVDHSP